MKQTLSVSSAATMRQERCKSGLNGALCGCPLIFSLRGTVGSRRCCLWVQSYLRQRGQAAEAGADQGDGPPRARLHPYLWAPSACMVQLSSTLLQWELGLPPSQRGSDRASASRVLRGSARGRGLESVIFDAPGALLSHPLTHPLRAPFVPPPAAG